MNILSAIEDTGGLDTERILVNSDKLFVFKNSKRLRTDVVQVTADDQGRLSKCPKSHVRAFLDIT